MVERRGTVRIIAGQWRGRKLRFPAAADLRPTSDRRRETLFNWLGPELTGLRCLDLFAGSGALGFEAASRGAAHVVMVDSARAVVRGLETSRDDLDAMQVRIHGMDVRRFLASGNGGEFDIVFLDPPFARPDLANDALHALQGPWLARSARIYVEIDAHRRAALPVPSTWRLHRESHGGDAHGLLYVTDG